MSVSVDLEAEENSRRTRDGYKSDSGGESDMSEEIPYPCSTHYYQYLPASTSRGRKNVFNQSSSSSESNSKDSTEHPAKENGSSSEVLSKGTKRIKIAPHGHSYSKPLSRDTKNDSVLAELKKTNMILATLVKRVKKTERRNKVIEEQVGDGGTSSASSSLSTKEVPKKSHS